MIPWIALCFWPVLSAVFYNRFALPVALLTTLLGGYLLLPNAGWIAPPWLIAGAILERMELLENKQARPGRICAPKSRPRPRHRRLL